MTATITSLLLALFLLAANAFFVAAEFALVKSRGFRVDTMAEEKTLRRAAAAEDAAERRGLSRLLPARHHDGLARPRLGRRADRLGLLTPVLLPLGMSEHALHFTSFLIGFLVFSSLHIVVGEQVPKTLAIREPEPVSQWIAYPLHVTYVVLYPLNWLLNTSSRSILQWLGIRESSQHEILTDVEIEGLVEESAEHGKMAIGQAEYIQNVFRFGELEVSDVMVHRTEMVTVNADDLPEDIVTAVLKAAYTRIPLWRGSPENIVGILHAKDLLRAVRAVDGDLSKIDLAAIVRPPWFVPDIRPLSEQLKAFRRRKTHFALVVDEYGEVMGLVTLEDLLEEIVGDITDEHDVVVTGAKPQADGSVMVDGTVPIRDLNRLMDWSLPDEEATTIAGLVIHEARAIPEAGQSFTFHGFRFRVLRKERNRITALHVQPLVRKATAAKVA